MSAKEEHDIVVALAAENPIYDHYCCFFCGALAPVDWTDMHDDHTVECLWWQARQLLDLPPWPD